MQSFLLSLDKNIRSRILKQILIALFCNVLFSCYLTYKIYTSSDQCPEIGTMLLFYPLYSLYSATWLSLYLFVCCNVLLKISIYLAKRKVLESNLSLLLISMIRYTLVYFLISFFEEDTEGKIRFTLIYLIIVAITEFVEIYNSHRSSANTMDH
jgi:hypothetical protein